MEIGPGRELAHYRLVEKIGEGGMGQVWKALDTKLDREVAIKILPEQFAGDHDRVQRFEREAKVLASLNQPNIAAIYGFEQEQGVTFLVMELVPGEDLSQRLARGPIPVEDVLRIGSQVARALDAAHEHGVIHRDLKPANVLLTEDGTAKVLDFGLAKTFEGGAISGEPATSPTITSTGTVAGVILGTATYMSPEQARGKPLDKRTDIWSFGCLLFECLAGRSVFGGETISDSLAAILRGEPDWSGRSGTRASQPPVPLVALRSRPPPPAAGGCACPASGPDPSRTYCAALSTPSAAPPPRPAARPRAHARCGCHPNPHRPANSDPSASRPGRPTYRRTRPSAGCACPPATPTRQ